MDDRGAETQEMFRWQGVVDSKLAEHDRRLSDINGDARRAREAAESTVVQLAVLKTKVALWSTMGSLLGAGLMTAVIQWVTAT